MSVFVDVAVAEGNGNKTCPAFVELITFREFGVLVATAVFEVADASDLGDVGFDAFKGLV